MLLRRFVNSSTIAWGVAIAAMLTCFAVAAYKNPSPSGITVMKLAPSSADKLAAIKQHPKFSPSLLTPRNPSFLTSNEMKSKLKTQGLLPPGSNSITLTPNQPSQSLPGSASTTGFLSIVGASLSILANPGFIEIEAPELSNQPVGLQVNFAPTSAQKPYIVEVDYNALGGATNIIMSQLGGPTASVPIDPTAQSAQVAVIVNDSYWTSLTIWPDHGDIAISAIKVTGF